MRKFFAMLVFAISCGPMGTSPTPTPQTPDPLPPGEEIAQPLPAGCAFSYVSVTAVETASSVQLMPRGSMTDAASVVTVLVTTSAPTEPVIRYTAGVENCATASFKQAVLMDATGTEAKGETYTGIISAQQAGTHVCWKILSPVCGVKTSAPDVGAAAYEYTTR